MRSGLQYGADFITYSEHPSRVHAEFSVLVQNTQLPSRLGWQELEIVNRLSHQVGALARLPVMPRHAMLRGTHSHLLVSF